MKEMGRLLVYGGAIEIRISRNHQKREGRESPSSKKETRRERKS